MTFTLAPDELTDLELVDLIATGDPAAAARFWVRHWPTALAAGRGLVEPAEVPGLAAEALVGTLASIRVGSGPHDNSGVFVIDAVHELGGEEFDPSLLSAVQYPDVFPSAMMGTAFGAMRREDRQLIWAAYADGVPDAEIADAVGIKAGEAEIARDTLLGLLQESYVRRHTELGVQPECAATHSFLGSAIGHPETSFPTETWMHLSECVVCTEAFHELSHSPVALGPLLGAAAFPGALPEAGAAVAPVETAPVETVPAEAAAEVAADEAADVVDPIAVMAADADAGFEYDRDVIEPDLGTDVTENIAAVAAVDDAEEPEAAPRPLFADDAAPISLVSPGFEADDEPEPTSHVDETRRRRPFALILGAAALVGVIALVVTLLSRGSDPTSPAAADGTPTGTPTTSAPADPTGSTSPDDVTTTTGSKPTASATAKTTQDSTAKATPTKSPTTKPSSTPTRTTGPTSTPTTSAPPSSPTPTPTPTATPTKRCNALQHLLGVC